MSRARGPAAPHPLVERVRGTLRRPDTPAARAFLDRLDARLRAVAEIAGGVSGAALPVESPSERARARRFLRRRAGRWHDGDEDLVRGWLDSWSGAGRDARRDAARALVRAAGALSRLEAGEGTLWFFVWELESLAAALGPTRNESATRNVSIGRRT